MNALRNALLLIRGLVIWIEQLLRHLIQAGQHVVFVYRLPEFEKRARQHVCLHVVRCDSDGIGDFLHGLGEYIFLAKETSRMRISANLPVIVSKDTKCVNKHITTRCHIYVLLLAILIGNSLRTNAASSGHLWRKKGKVANNGSFVGGIKL